MQTRKEMKKKKKPSMEPIEESAMWKDIKPKDVTDDRIVGWTWPRDRCTF